MNGLAICFDSFRTTTILHRSFLWYLRGRIEHPFNRTRAYVLSFGIKQVYLPKPVFSSTGASSLQIRTSPSSVEMLPRHLLARTVRTRTSTTFKPPNTASRALSVSLTGKGRFSSTHTTPRTGSASSSRVSTRSSLSKNATFLSFPARGFHSSHTRRANGEPPLKSPFQTFVDVLKEELQKNRELQDNVKQLQGDVDKFQDSEALRKAREVYERAKVSISIPSGTHFLSNVVILTLCNLTAYVLDSRKSEVTSGSRRTKKGWRSDRRCRRGGSEING